MGKVNPNSKICQHGKGRGEEIKRLEQNTSHSLKHHNSNQKLANFLNTIRTQGAKTPSAP